MKAIRIHKLGGTEVLRYEDAPLAEPKAGEFFIRTWASSMNPADWQMIISNPPDR